ncbi:hypothetical protein ACKKBF_B11085 [Auxenochlorella protothecoides x Auxenochlorella symbiontica]
MDSRPENGPGSKPIDQVSRDSRTMALPMPYYGSTMPFDADTEYKVVQREQVANPAPLGLFAFGLTTALLQGANTAITDPETTEFWVFAYAFAYGGLAQLLAGMWEYKRQNTFGATAFSSFGAFWIGFAIHGTLVANGLYVASAGAAQITLSLWGIFTFILMVATLELNFALFSLFITLSTLFFLLVAGLTTPNPWTKIAGWWGLMVAAIAWYIAAADVINEQYKRTVLPVGRWSVGTPLAKGLKAALSKVPLLGKACVAGMDREDALSGYTKKAEDLERPGTPHDYRATRLHNNHSLYQGAWDGEAVRYEQEARGLGSAVGPY